MSDPATRRLARRLRHLGRESRSIARASQAAMRSVEVTDGPISYYDADGNSVLQLGVSGNNTAYTIVETNTEPPPVPTDPDVNQLAGGVEIVWDGTFVEANAPTDFSHVEIHVAGDLDEESTDETQIGTFPSDLGGRFFFPLTAAEGSFYFWLVAVNRSGIESTKSVAVQQAAAPVRAETDNAPPPPVATLLGIPGPGMVFLRWEPPINPDPMEYWVYGSPTPNFDTIPSLLIGSTMGTSFTVRELSDSVAPSVRALPYDVDYYYRVVAVDEDGPAPQSSPELAVRPSQLTGGDIAENTIIGEHMVAGTFTGDLFAGDIFLATTFTTGTLDEAGNIVGRRVEINTSGIRLFDSAGNALAILPTGSNESPYFSGQFEMQIARILQGLTIESVNNEIARNAGLTLAQGITTPKTGPLLEVVYDTLLLDVITKVGARSGSSWSNGVYALNPSQIVGMGWHAGVQKFIISQVRTGGCRTWVFNTDGSIATVPAGQPDAGQYWVDDWQQYTDISSVWGDADDLMQYGLVGYSGTGWRVQVKTVADGIYRTNLIGTIVYPTQRPVVIPDITARNYCLIENDTAGARDNLTLRRFRAVATNLGTVTYTQGVSYGLDTARGYELAGAAIGGFDWGSVIRLVSATRGGVGGFHVNTDAEGAAFDTTRGFDTNGTITGLTWDGTSFWSVNTSGQLTKYTNWAWTDDANNTVYAAYTWYDSKTAGTGVHETDMSARSSVVMPKRARLRVTMPRVPDDGGVDSPDQWRLYAVRTTTTAPATSTLRRQTQGGNATGSTSYVMTDTVGTGIALTPIAFPPSTPAWIRTDTVDAAGRRLFEVSGDGKGRWPWMMPVGGAVFWPPSPTTPPTGWFRFTGQQISQTTYPEMFEKYGTTYNTGGETAGNFRLPNITAIQGLTIIGKAL